MKNWVDVGWINMEKEILERANTETSAFKLQTPGKFPEEYKLQFINYLLLLIDG